MMSVFDPSTQSYRRFGGLTLNRNLLCVDLSVNAELGTGKCGLCPVANDELELQVAHERGV